MGQQAWLCRHAGGPSHWQPPMAGAAEGGSWQRARHVVVHPASNVRAGTRRPLYARASARPLPAPRCPDHLFKLFL